MKFFALPDMKTSPFDLARPRAALHVLDNGAQFLERPPAQRVGAFTLAIEYGPGDAFPVDGKAPVLQLRHILRHACLLAAYSAAALPFAA